MISINRYLINMMEQLPIRKMSHLANQPVNNWLIEYLQEFPDLISGY